MSFKKIKIPFLALVVIISAAFAYSYYAEASMINKSNATSPNLRNGLVGHWTFDGKDTSASVAYDKSGRGNNGTRNGGTTLKSGKIGQAMRFDGTSGYVSALDNNSLDLSTRGTVSFWYKRSAAGRQSAFGKWDTGQQSYVLQHNTDDKIYWFVSGTGSDSIYFTSTNTYIDTNWNHLVGVYNGSTLVVYRNGVLIAGSITGSVPSSLYNGTATLENRYLQTYYSNDLMDDNRVYNRALSTAEIQELYKMGGGKINTTDTTKPTLKTGLVGHWTFDGKDTSASVAYDKSGNGNNGTRAGGTTLKSGKIGQAMNFDGTNGCLSTSSALVTSGDYTAAVWYKTTNGATFQQIISQYNNSPAIPNLEVTIGIGGDNTVGVRMHNTLSQSVQVSTSTSANKWHYAVAVKSGLNLSLYYEGNYIGTATLTGTVTTPTNFRIGCRYYGTTDTYFNGILDDVRVYSRALSTAEIQELYKMGGGKINTTDTTKPTLKTGLVGHWTFDGKDTSASVAYDKSGNGNNGTRAGGTTLKSGKIGQAMNFDGTNGCLSTSSALVTSGDYTAAVWYKTTNGATFQQIISQYNNSPAIPNLEVTIGIGGDNTVGVRMHNTLSQSVQVSTSTSANKWHYAVAVKSGLNLSLYYEGNYIGTATLTGTVTTPTNFRIGCRYYGTTDTYFNGILDDVRVYSRALSTAEIQELYKMGGGKVNTTDTTKPTLKTGLVGHWTFDGKDTTASVAYDKSGRGNNGTRNGGTTLKSGKIGQGMKFDGSSGIITINNSVFDSFADKIVVSSWVKFNSLPANGDVQTILGKDGYASNKGYNLQVYYDGSNYKIYFSIDATNNINNYPLVAGRWYHFMGVYDGANITTYVDGVPLGTVTTKTGNITAAGNGLVYIAKRDDGIILMGL